MVLPLYLAMTAAEISRAAELPGRTAYMACHFSPYSTGLSGFPDTLPASSILILNDRTPVQGHDPGLIASQLLQATQDLHTDSVLLDFQRPDNPLTAAVTRAILDTLSCPVSVSEFYARDLSCAVFLAPPALDCPLSKYLSAWNGREIWLEAALDSARITITEEGSNYAPLFPPETPEPSHHAQQLHCRYHLSVTENAAQFTLFRTYNELSSLLEEAEQLGVTRAVGLYQELHSMCK